MSIKGKISMQLLRHAPIGVKVSLAPAFAIVCLVVVVAMSQWASVSASRSLAEINRSRVPALSAAAELGREIAVLSGLVNQSLVWEGAGVKADRIAVLDHQIARTFEDMGQRIRSQRDGALWSSDERQKFAQIEQTFQRFRSTVADTLDIKSTGLGAASGFITRSEASSAELQKRINELVQGQQARTGAVATDAEGVARRNQATTLAALVAAVVLASAATWWCARLIVKPLAQASAIATAVAAGDLHTPTFADIRDQTGMVLGALRKVTQSLTLIVGEIRDSAGQIDLASNEIAKGNNRLSERTSQAAAAVEQTAAALEQLTALVRQSAVNAVEADKLAIDAASVAHQGAEEVSEAVRSMEETSLQAKRIGEIVSVIDGIAFQTNILALNAAVEAARAGESGRGFAVVAQEVRVLASRSGEAAKQIRDLIGQSVASIQAGAGKVQTAGSSMANIVQSIERVSGVVNQISRAAAAQATGIEQINLAVVEMDRFTRQNATLVEEALATAGSLKHQSSRLVSSISVFRT